MTSCDGNRWLGWIGRFARAIPVVLLIAAPTAAQESLKQSEQSKPRFGVYRATLTGLSEPGGCGFLNDGTIVLTDRFGGRVLFMEPEGKLVREWPQPPPPVDESGVRWPMPEPMHGSQLRGLAVCIRDQSISVSKAVDATVFRNMIEGAGLTTFGGFGPAPDQLGEPRGMAVTGNNIAIADAGKHRVAIFTLPGTFVSEFGSWGTGDGQFRSPSDVAVDDAGLIYVADTDNHRVQVFSSEGKHLRTFGERGEFEGRFAQPEGIAVHADRIYVADTGNHRVQVFDLDGSFQYYWGKHVLDPHEGEGKIHYPSSVAISPDGNHAVVCEAFEDRCQVFAPLPPGDKPELDFAALYRGDAGAHYGMRATTAGHYLVIPEPDAHSVLVYDLRKDQPILVSRFGRYGDAPGQFSGIKDVYLRERDMRLFVLDETVRRLHVFQLDAPKDDEIKYRPQLCRLAKSIELDSAIENTPDVPPDFTAITGSGNDLYLLDARNGQVHVLGDDLTAKATLCERGTAPGELLEPTDLCVDAGGRVLVVDATLKRVTAIAADGKVDRVYDLGSLGAKRPIGIAVDSAGTMHVADMLGHRIMTLDAQGKLASSFGGKGIGAGELFKPTDVVVDQRGRLIVLDYGNHRGQILDSNGKFILAFGSQAYIRPTR